MKYFHGMCFLNSASTYLMIWSYENRMFPLLISNVEGSVSHSACTLVPCWIMEERTEGTVTIVSVHSPWSKMSDPAFERRMLCFDGCSPKIVALPLPCFLVTKHVFAANLSCSLFKPAFQIFFHCAVHATRCVSAFQVASWRRSKRRRSSTLRAHWNGTWRVTEPRNR